MPQAGHGHGDQGRVIRLHAGQRLSRENRRGFATQHQKWSALEPGEEMPEVGQLSGRRRQRLDDGRVPIDVPSPVVAAPVGALGEASPGFLVTEGDLPEGLFQETGRGLEVRLWSVPSDVGHDLVQGVALELGTDVVEDGSGQGVRQTGPETHGEQSAERGADRDETMQAGHAQQMAQVVQILDRMVAAPIFDIGGTPAPAIVGADHPAPARQVFRKLVEVLRVPGQTSEAKGRRPAVFVRAGIVPVVEPGPILRGKAPFLIAGLRHVRLA